MTWQDRITGAAAPVPKAPGVPGQWKYVGSEPTRVRDAMAQSGDVLLPDEEGRSGNWPDAPGPDRRLVLDPDAQRRVSRIGERLEQLEGQPWQAWVACSPIEALGKSVELTETSLERALRKCLGALEAVCARPRTHLAAEEERLLVSRCRRASPRAAQVLAQHSEDWSKRTVFGVEPKRVLGYVREELHDIYENRLTLTLVEHLDRWLCDRVRSLRRARDAAAQALEYDNLGGAHWRRAYRIAELWGESYDQSDLLRRVEEALSRATALRRRVLALRDSELARRLVLPRARTIHLRLTNILSNDDAYRRVAELWKAWEDTSGTALSPTPQERWEAAQATARSFDRFARLVVVRALTALGFDSAMESEGTEPPAHGRMSLHAPWADLTLEVQHLGLVLAVPAGGASGPLRIVALPAPLEASSSVEAWLSTLPRDPNLLIVALPSEDRADSRARPRLRSLGNGGDGPGPMIMAAAPWDLESVERVARAIRWYVATALCSRFPRVVPLPPGWAAPAPESPYVAREVGGLRCLLPPRSGVPAWPALAVRIQTQRGKADGVQTRLAAETKGRSRLQLRNELQNIQEPLAMDEAVLAALDEAMVWTRQVLTCPICGAATVNAGMDGPCFRAACMDCAAEWGLARCSADHRVPLLALGEAAEAHDADPDRSWGADVLALRRGAGFHCPTCSEIVR